MRTLNWTLLLAMATGPMLFAQQEAPQPAPARSNQILGQQLIVWSQMQKPEPVPQQPKPLPPPDAQNHQGQAPSPDAQNQTQQTQKDAQSEADNTKSISNTFTGTIAKVEGRYVIETSGTMAYQIDDQKRASRYEGKRVKVVGSLDRTTGTIHVTSIELLS